MSNGFEKQISNIREASEMKARVDELGDDGIAILVSRAKVEGETQLSITSYGNGQQTEFLGLLGYANILISREYFRDDDEE